MPATLFVILFCFVYLWQMLAVTAFGFLFSWSMTTQGWLDVIIIVPALLAAWLGPR